MNSLFTNLIDEFRCLDSMEESVLVAIKKPLRAKYSSCGRTGYKEETCYKLYPEQRPSASSITDVLFAAYSDFSHSVLPVASLTNSYMPIAAHSDFSHSVLPIASLTNSHIPITAYSNFSHSVSPVILLTNPYSVLPVVAYSKSIGGSALLVKYLFGD